jgi:hypothetical protein
MAPADLSDRAEILLASNGPMAVAAVRKAVVRSQESMDAHSEVFQ